VARPISTYAMYKARIFAEDDTLLASYVGTLPGVQKECKKHFLEFDSTAAIRRYLDKNGVYAKGHQSAKDYPFLIPPAFVHISPTSSPYLVG